MRKKGTSKKMTASGSGSVEGLTENMTLQPSTKSENIINRVPTHQAKIKSLAHRASSHERLASSLGIQTHQIRQARDGRRAASVDLHERLLALQTSNVSDGGMSDKELGKLKHQMICRHRYEQMRNPFVCHRCWTHVPICVCPLFERVEGRRGREVVDGATETVSTAKGGEPLQQSKAQLPQLVKQVIVWTHHDEWGRSSNTGSLLPLGLENTELWMKGLDEHETKMKELLDREDLTLVVLWPGKSGENTFANTTVTELKRRFSCTERDQEGETNTISPSKGIVLISIEGTWNNAKKMVNRLPSSVLRLDLGEAISTHYSILDGDNNNSLLPKPTSSSPSLLAPLRRQGKGKFGKSDNISTLEATVIALLAFGLSEEDATWILDCARTKIDSIRQYTGKTYARC